MFQYELGCGHEPERSEPGGTDSAARESKETPPDERLAVPRDSDHQVNAPIPAAAAPAGPVDLRFAKRHRDPQDFSFPPTVHSNRFRMARSCTVPLTRTFRSGHPSRPPGISRSRNCSRSSSWAILEIGRDLGPTQLLREPCGSDSFHVHLGNGQLQGLRPASSLQGLRVKRLHLGDLELQPAWPRSCP